MKACIIAKEGTRSVYMYSRQREDTKDTTCSINCLVHTRIRHWAFDCEVDNSTVGCRSYLIGKDLEAKTSDKTVSIEARFYL